MHANPLADSRRRDEYLAHFRARVVQDALAEAEAAYWCRRAEVFEQARPRPSDFTGRATADNLAAQDARLTATAEACRAKAIVWGAS